MDSSSHSLRRTTAGIIALLLLAGGCVLALVADEETSAQSVLMQAACFRIGLVMAAFWLAYPSLQNESTLSRLIAGVILGSVLLFALLRLPLRIVLPLGLAVVVIGLILRPKSKHRPGNRSAG